MSSSMSELINKANDWLNDNIFTASDIQESANKVNYFITKTIPKAVDDFFSDSSLGASVGSDLVGKLQGFYDLVAVFVTIWLTYRTLQYIYGRGNLRLMDMLWDSFFKFFVVIIAIQYTDVIQMVQDVAKDVREFLDGGTPVWSALSLYIVNAILVCMVYFSESSWLGGLLSDSPNVFAVVFAIAGIFASLLMVVSTFLRIYVANVITFFLMVITFPLILFLMIFDWFKGSFKQWLQLLLNNLIVILLFHTVIRAIVNFAHQHTEKYISFASQDESILMILLYFFCWGFLIQIFCNLIVAFAQNITSVSMENTASHGISGAVGAAGAGVGFGLGSAVLGARMLSKAAPAIGGMVARSAAGQAVKGAADAAKSVTRSGINKLKSKAYGG